MVDDTGIGDPPDGLTAAEIGMWQAFRNGSVYDLRSGDAMEDDPHGGHPWGPERSVRARIVCWLLLEGPPALSGRVSSLKLSGLQITDVLDLAGGEVVPYAELKHCRFEKEVLVPEAKFTTLRLVNCSIPRVEAARVHTEGDLHLPRCRIHNGMRLTDAQIGTDLLINQAVIYRDRRGNSIMGDGLSVGQDLQAEMMESHGQLSLRGAKVGVSFSLRGSKLANPYGQRALNAPQMTVERTLYMTPAALGDPPMTSGMTPPRGTRIQRFECQGGVRLDDGRFGDAVDLAQARFTLENDQEVSLRRVQTPSCASSARPRSAARSSCPAPRSSPSSTSRPAGRVPAASRWVASVTRTSCRRAASRSPGGWPGWRPRPPSTTPSRTRSWPPSCATAARTPTPARCCSPSSSRRRETLPIAAKLWGFAQDWTVAYGYRPGRAALWMAVLWAVSAVAFARADHPAIKPGEHPNWNPALFSLDLLLPVIDLGQDSYWQLRGGWQWFAAILILLGWVLATTVAAGATRLLRRN